MESNTRRILAIVAGVVLLFGAVGGVLLMTNDSAQAFVQDLTDSEEDELEGEDVPITGEALERASEAALEYTGEGEVTDTEVGDEEGYYEVEVTLDNGREVDIHLDEDFNVLSEEMDGVNEED